MNSRYPTSIGPYAVERQLGSGGMGVVLAAKHRVLGRQVAIKLRERGSSGEEALLAERFRQGAILQAELDHRYIGRVHEYYEMPQLQALILEYLDGGSIDVHLKDAGGPLPISDCLEIGLRAAQALEFGHRRGVVHRDIKPANLMLAVANVPTSVRVTDFGVAKSVENSPDLTVAGANVGTLWYMPPEQFNQEAPTPQADVYSLGATIYEMLTGHIPFESQETSQIFSRFLDAIPPPPIHSRNPAVPAALVAVVDQALELDLDRRTPTAGIFSLLLRAVGERDGLVTRDNAVQKLFEETEEERIAHAIATLPAHQRPDIGAALSSLESRIVGGFAVRASIATQRTPFDGLGPNDATPTNLSAPDFPENDFTDPGGIDDDDDDHTMIMRAFPIPEDE